METFMPFSTPSARTSLCKNRKTLLIQIGWNCSVFFGKHTNLEGSDGGIQEKECFMVEDGRDKREETPFWKADLMAELLRLDLMKCKNDNLLEPWRAPPNSAQEPGPYCNR